MLLIKAKNVRNFTLALAANIRPGKKFTRVSKQFLERVESDIKFRIKDYIKTIPSIGKTIK